MLLERTTENGPLVESATKDQDNKKLCWKCQKEMDGLTTHMPEEMTSKDYYFDSYAHFGIHEVELKYFFWKQIKLTLQNILWNHRRILDSF